MKKLFCILVVAKLVCTNLSIKAQNLVLNPSFEDTIPCAVYTGYPLMNAVHWFRPTNGTSDYFCTQFTSCNYAGVPNNGFGYQQAHGLNSYVGFGVYVPAPAVNYREYITGTLLDSLEVGKRYCVSFYVSFADNDRYYTDDIGAYFCSDTSTLLNYNTNQVLNLVPQVENIQGNMLSDTMNWMLITGSFIAQGGEKFITIGNFRNDGNTTVFINQSGINYESYYFLDDVSVTDCTVGITEVSERMDQIMIYPNPAVETFSIRKLDDSIFEAGNVMKLYDLYGNLLVQEKLLNSSENWELDISMLSSGLYIVQLIDIAANTSNFEKLIVE